MSDSVAAQRRKQHARIADLDADKAARELEALQRKHKFISTIAGAKAKSTYLERDLLKQFPWAAANFAIMHILNGDVKIKTAGEAAQVAKLMVEIGRMEMGESNSSVPLTSDERQTRIDAAKRLEEELKSRREALEAEAEAGVDPAGDGGLVLPAEVESESGGAVLGLIGPAA